MNTVSFTGIESHLICFCGVNEFCAHVARPKRTLCVSQLLGTRERFACLSSWEQDLDYPNIQLWAPQGCGCRC